MSTHGFVGDLLLRAGISDPAGISRAIEAQAARHVTVGRALSELGIAGEAAVAQAIASALHLEFIDGDAAVDPETAALVSGDFCRKRRIVPVGASRQTVKVAVADPLDYSALQDLEFRTGRTAAAVVVTETWIERALVSLYPPVAEVASYDQLATVAPTGEIEAAEASDEIDVTALVKDVNLPPTVRLINLILSEAAGAGASDIHIEPQESHVQVRQRVDGLLREVMTIPLHLRDQAISRVKILSGMDIAERRKPQDGRSRLKFEGRRIDLRVSTLPTQFGEKIVIRLLNNEKSVPTIDQVGFTAEHLDLMRSFLSRPQGMILVTGPTGSGKTSTLYTALTSIKSSTNNIITLEDPIELQVPGVNQMQINARAGVTFASGLRSILRQDPNVILVGEIRDQETADIALQAAQTGHLLLSTLHTNNAPATITRLFDLGVQPFLVASSLIGIVAQRLVRRPCPACAVEQAPRADVLARLGGASKLPADARWLAPRGCDECGQVGFKGRLALHEILEVTDDVRELISNRAPDFEIRKAAQRGGMRSLLEDGIAKAARGLTTLEEVLRVVSHGEAHDSGHDVAAPAPAIAPAVPAPMPALVRMPPPAAEAMSAPAERRRVLVVEDSPTIVSVVKYFLELEGFEVFVAEDGARGLDLALQKLPDVIVSDVQMPGMDGVEMVTALRADARTVATRILMLTSESSVESEAKGLAAGADDYILKPVEPRRLAARVKALLARARSHAA